VKTETIITIIFYAICAGAMLTVTVMSWRADKARKKNAAVWQRREEEMHRLHVRFMEAAIKSQEPKEPW
jgi:hypothetical protein